MSTRLLQFPDGGDAPSPPEPACDALIIGGVPYRHSAAKFWARLVDEALAVAPDCTRIELSVLTAERYDPIRLDPLAELQRDARELAAANLHDVIRDCVAQLNLYGPPPLVHVRVLADSTERMRTELPADCADAETFIYLASWLLEWARLPRDTWQNPLLDGQFVARDKRRRRVYHVRFDSRRDPVREGLYRVTLALDARVADAAATA